MTIAVDRINELQKLILKGGEPSVEDMASAIQALREERGVAGEAKAERVAKAKAAANIDIASLFAPKKEAE